MDYATVTQVKHNTRLWVREPYNDGTARYKYLLLSNGRPTPPEWAKVEDFTIFVIPSSEDRDKVEIYGQYCPMLDWNRWARQIFWVYESAEELTDALSNPWGEVERMRAEWLADYGDLL